MQRILLSLKNKMNVKFCFVELTPQKEIRVGAVMGLSIWINTSQGGILEKAVISLQFWSEKCFWSYLMVYCTAEAAFCNQK